MHLTKVTLLKLFYSFFLVVCLPGNGKTQDALSNPLQLMFYNVENLFDVFNDTAKNDDDFLPGGVLRWNTTRYKKKINSIYKTIVAAGEWAPPEIVAMCEVENKKVLEDLVYGTWLSKYNYRIIHEESPDQRGIDVCLIYRSDAIKVMSYNYSIPGEFSNDEFTSRSILYVKVLYGTDTIHLIVNHWPSRRGGVLAGERLRFCVSAMVKEKADSIAQVTKGEARIIIMGDFNSTPDDLEMKFLLRGTQPGSQLVNLSADAAFSGLGTYRYMGIWEMIDQVVVSKNLLSGDIGIYTGSELLSVFKPDFLLIRDPKYPGFCPFSTYRGYRYQGGFSDHLPILLKLGIKGLDQVE